MSSATKALSAPRLSRNCGTGAPWIEWSPQNARVHQVIAQLAQKRAAGKQIDFPAREKEHAVVHEKFNQNARE